MIKNNPVDVFVSLFLVLCIFLDRNSTNFTTAVLRILPVF